MSNLRYKDINIIMMNMELSIEYYVKEIDEIIELINGNDYDSQMIRDLLNDLKILMNEYVSDLTDEFNIGGEIEMSHFIRCISDMKDIARKTPSIDVEDRLIKLIINLEEEFTEYVRELNA